MTFVEAFFVVLFMLVFFGFSVYAVVFFVLTPRPSMLKLHWTMKFVWYYGISFAIFVVAAVFLSFVAWLALKLLGA